MKYLSTYKLFESKKETQDIVKDIFSKLPKGFYYRVKYSGRGGSIDSRNISSSLGEHDSIYIKIVRISDKDQAKIWSVDKKNIKEKSFKHFEFKTVKVFIDELLQRLPNYKLSGFMGGTGGRIYIGSKYLGSNQEVSTIELELKCSLAPSFKVKGNSDNEIGDIFSDVFDVWVPDISVKESGDFYKISSTISNMSPYKVTPMSDSIKSDFIDSINRFEIAMECDLLNASLQYRNYAQRQEDYDFILSTKGFNSTNIERNKELALEFIKNNEIIGFTIIFKKG